MTLESTQLLRNVDKKHTRQELGHKAYATKINTQLRNSKMKNAKRIDTNRQS